VRIRVLVEPGILVPAGPADITILALPEATAVVAAELVDFAGPNEPAAQVFPLHCPPTVVPDCIAGTLEKSGPATWTFTPPE